MSRHSRPEKISVPMANGARPYHIGPQPNEISADSSCEWDDAIELRLAGALVGSTLSEDRRVIIFDDAATARTVLEELCNITTA